MTRRNVVEVDPDFYAWIATWAWRFGAAVVVVRGANGQPQPLLLPVREVARA